MSEYDTFIAITEVIQSYGIWIVFFWLYFTEKRSHEETRQAYRHDLREVAGFQSNIRPNRNTTTEQNSQ